MRPRSPTCSSTSSHGRAVSPLVLASSIAFGVLSSAAKVGGGEGLLRGHDDGCVRMSGNWEDVLLTGRSPELVMSGCRASR